MPLFTSRQRVRTYHKHTLNSTPPPSPAHLKARRPKKTQEDAKPTQRKARRPNPTQQPKPIQQENKPQTTSQASVNVPQPAVVLPVRPLQQLQVSLTTPKTTLTKTLPPKPRTKTTYAQVHDHGSPQEEVLWILQQGGRGTMHDMMHDTTWTWRKPRRT